MKSIILGKSDFSYWWPNMQRIFWNRQTCWFFELEVDFFPCQVAHCGSPALDRPLDGVQERGFIRVVVLESAGTQK